MSLSLRLNCHPHTGMSVEPCTARISRPSICRITSIRGNTPLFMALNVRRFDGGAPKCGTMGPSPAPVWPWHDAQFSRYSLAPSKLGFGSPALGARHPERPRISVADSIQPIEWLLCMVPTLNRKSSNLMDYAQTAMGDSPEDQRRRLFWAAADLTIGFVVRTCLMAQHLGRSARFVFGRTSSNSSTPALEGADAEV